MTFQQPFLVFALKRRTNWLCLCICRWDQGVQQDQSQHLQAARGRGDQGVGPQELYQRNWVLWVLQTEAAQAVLGPQPGQETVTAPFPTYLTTYTFWQTLLIQPRVVYIHNTTTTTMPQMDSKQSRSVIKRRFFLFNFSAFCFDQPHTDRHHTHKHLKEDILLLFYAVF